MHAHPPSLFLFSPSPSSPLRALARTPLGGDSPFSMSVLQSSGRSLQVSPGTQLPSGSSSSGTVMISDGSAATRDPPGFDAARSDDPGSAAAAACACALESALSSGCGQTNKSPWRTSQGNEVAQALGEVLLPPCGMRVQAPSPENDLHRARGRE
jgi:hypothetical protein